MDHKAFFELTAKVRDAQKKYYSTPKESYYAKQDALKTSKKLEAELDAEIKRVREYLKRKELERISPTLNFGE